MFPLSDAKDLKKGIEIDEVLKNLLAENIGLPPEFHKAKNTANCKNIYIYINVCVYKRFAVIFSLCNYAIIQSLNLYLF